MNGLVHPRLRFHIFAKIAVVNPKTDISSWVAWIWAELYFGVLGVWNIFINVISNTKIFVFKISVENLISSTHILTLPCYLSITFHHEITFCSFIYFVFSHP